MEGNNELESSLELDLAPFRRALGQALGQVKQFGASLKNSLSQATAGLNGASSGFGRFRSEVEGANQGVRRLGMGMRDLERIVGGIMLAQGFYGLKAGIEDGVTALAQFMSDMEKAQIALEYFLATPEQAGAFLIDMQNFAAETAFNTNQAVSLSRKLMAAQFAPNDVKGVMTILNDASAAAGGTAEQMDRIVLAISQIKTNGKLAGQEMRQLAEAGIPIYKIIQEELKLTGEEVMNVGDLKIPGEKAVQAILDGLEKRYKGAADRIADTTAGMWQTIVDSSKMIGAKIFQAPYAAFQRFTRVIRDTLEDVRNHMQAGGLGRALEEMIPKELWTYIRSIAGSIKSLGRSFVTMWKAIQPVVEVLLGSLTVALGILMPILAAMAKAISQVAYAATQSIPGLKYLAAAIVGLLVAQGVARVMLFFWGVLRIGTIASAVAAAVRTLSKAIVGLSMAILRNPIVLGIVAIGGALLYFTGMLKQVVGWIDALINRLAGLGGFDIDLQLPNSPTDTSGIDDYVSKWGDAAGAMEDVGDETDKAGKDAAKAAKEFKKFTASFDELYQIPDAPKDKDSGGKKPGKGDGGLGDIPDMSGGDIFDDWKLPKEIKLPELVWPKISDIPWPDFIVKWLGGEFKWPSWPKMPPFPPLPALSWDLSWEGVINALRLKWQAFLDWIKQPLAFPVPSLAPVFEGLLSWFPRIALAWQEFWESLPWPDWGAQLEATFQPIPLAIGNLLTGLEAAWIAGWNTLFDWASQGATAFVTTLGLIWADMEANFKTSMEKLGNAWTTGMEAIKSFASEGLAAIGTFFAEAFAKWQADAALFFSTLGLAFLLLWKTLSSTAKTWATKVAESFASAWTSAKTSFATFATGLAAGLVSLLSSFQTNWTAGWTKVSSILSTKLDGMKTFWENHKGTILTVAGLLLSGVALVFTGGLSGILAGLVNWGPKVVAVFRGLPALIRTAMSTLPGVFTKLWDDIILKIPNVISAIVKPFKDLPDKIGKAVSGIGDKVKSALGNIKLPSFAESASGVKASFTRLADVAGFENGGIIGKDSIVRVGEKGRNEAIIPLQNRTAMQPFVDAVVQGIRGAGGNQNNNNNSAPPEILYVGNLIADDRSLRELEQRMKVVRMDRRGGN